jgi:hypothetical protein
MHRYPSRHIGHDHSLIAQYVANQMVGFPSLSQLAVLRQPPDLHPALLRFELAVHHL